jgi:PAS domain S-box-containing protein
VRSTEVMTEQGRNDEVAHDDDDAGSGVQRLRSSSVAAAVVVVAFVVWIYFEIGGTTATTWVNDLTEVAAAVVAAVACAWAATQGAATRRAWLWLAAASAAWAVGQAIWSWYELRTGEVPFPSLADLGFLAFAPLAVIGVLSFPFAPHRSLRRVQVLLDGLIIAGSLLFVSWATALGAAVHEGSETTVGQMVSLAYPATDIVLASTVFAALSLARGRWRVALALLGAGLILFALADSSFAYLNTTDSYGLGNVVDAGWVAGFLLIGLAALIPTADVAAREDHGEPSRGQLIIPYIPLGLAVLTGVLELVVGDGLDRFLVGTAVVIAALVLVRQLLSLLEAADLRRALLERNAELAESGTRQHLILSGAADGIVGLDGDGTIEFANPAALAMLDRSSDEVVGAALHAIVHAACEDHDCPLSSRLGTEGARSGAEDEFVRADGTAFPAEFSFTSFGDQGPAAGAVLVFRDVSERRAVDRMKDEFLSIVSHELRTPLTSVRGSLGLLGSGVAGELSSKASRMVDIAVDNTDRLIRLINDILDIERMASGHIPLVRQDCAAADLIAEALRVVTPMASGAGVTVEIGAVDGRVWADPDRMVQALTNLISNAVKFSAPGQVVVVSAAGQGPDVRFAVRDFGRGIPADKLELIFDRFRQVDASDARDKGGAGLGLAITKGIVEQHGGRIRVESTEGLGSTFSFQVPRAR